jgi:hypothetical protein
MGSHTFSQPSLRSHVTYHRASDRFAGSCSGAGEPVAHSLAGFQRPLHWHVKKKHKIACLQGQANMRPLKLAVASATHAARVPSASAHLSVFQHQPPQVLDVGQKTVVAGVTRESAAFSREQRMEQGLNKRAPVTNMENVNSGHRSQCVR